MKKIWAVRKDSEAVSPVIATILMVAITVVLAAVLYVMVLGFGADTTTTPTSSFSKTSTTDSYGNPAWAFRFGTLTDEVNWNDVTILLTDGTNSVSWTPTNDNLDDGAGDIYAFTNGTLGTLTITAKLMDQSGNGKVDGGDILTLGCSTTWSATTDYSLRALYETTDEPMAEITFSG